MSVASVTVTKTNVSLAPGQTDFLEAKVNHDDGHSDYNYRVVVSPEGLMQVTHSGSQVVVRAGGSGGQALLRVVSNHNPEVTAEVKILVAGGAPRANVAEAFRPPSLSVHNPPSPPYLKGGTPSLKVREGGGELLNSVGSSNSAFINQLYLEILHRPADAVGKTYWTKMLDKGLYTRDQVKDAFLKSI